jgi:hypothetical protein
MSKILLTLVLAFCTTLAHASTIINAPSSPYQHDFTQGDPRTGLCIGGGQCGKYNYLYVQYPSVWISTVLVTAHDAVGSKTNAKLELWVDGRFHSSVDVKAAGSTLTFNTFTYVRQLQFRSVHKDGSSGGDETMILQVQSF